MIPFDNVGLGIEVPPPLDNTGLGMVRLVGEGLGIELGVVLFVYVEPNIALDPAIFVGLRLGL